MTEPQPALPAIHPELQQSARWMPRFTFTKRNLWLLRLLLNRVPTAKPPGDVRIENIFIPAGDGKSRIRLRTYRGLSASTPSPLLFWLHGGGYILGKPEFDDPCCIQYVQATGIVIVSVDYRVAPEHPFPAALEDSHAAVQWTLAHAGKLGVDPARYAIGGESAGGGLAASLVQYIHDRNEPQPSLQILVFPMLDDRTCQRDDLPDPRLLTWNAASNRFGWQAYLGQTPGCGDPPPYSVPARRNDPSGLPPAWIGVGTLDLFHDECVAYAQKLVNSGVECDLYLVPGAYHAFDSAAPNSRVVQDFRTAQITAIKTHLTEPVTTGY